MRHAMALSSSADLHGFEPAAEYETRRPDRHCQTGFQGFTLRWPQPVSCHLEPRQKSQTAQNKISACGRNHKIARNDEVDCRTRFAFAALPQRDQLDYFFFRRLQLHED